MWHQNSSLSSDASSDSGLTFELVDVTQLRVVAEVKGVEGEAKRSQHHALGCFSVWGIHGGIGITYCEVSAWPAFRLGR